MKKLLLGTTALVAAGAAMGYATPVRAEAEPVKLVVGGSFRAAYGDIVSQNGSNQPQNTNKNDGIKQDSVIQFKGSTKLDNGIEPGVMFRLRAQNNNTGNGSSGVEMKYSYGFFKTQVGEFRIGQDDPGQVQQSIVAPQAGSLFGVNTPYFVFTNNPIGSNSTERNVTSEYRSAKLAYFSPTFAGFNFSVSYAPDQTKTNGFFPGTPPKDNNNTVFHYQNEVSGGAHYLGKFSSVGVEAFVGGATAQQTGHPAGTRPADPYTVSGGAAITVGPVQFGSTVQELWNIQSPFDGAGKMKQTTWDVGAVYTIGPFAVSANWSRGIYDAFTQSATYGGTDAQYDMYALIGNYVIGPGVELGAAVQYYHYKSGTQVGAAGAAGTASNPGDENNLSIMFGTVIKY